MKSPAPSTESFTRTESGSRQMPPGTPPPRQGRGPSRFGRLRKSMRALRERARDLYWLLFGPEILACGTRSELLAWLADLPEHMLRPGRIEFQVLEESTSPTEASAADRPAADLEKITRALRAIHNREAGSVAPTSETGASRSSFKIYNVKGRKVKPCLSGPCADSTANPEPGQR